jgi:hypothetical protein
MAFFKKKKLSLRRAFFSFLDTKVSLLEKPLILYENIFPSIFLDIFFTFKHA